MCRKDKKDNKQSSLRSIFKNVLIFVIGHHLFLRAHCFPRRRTVRFSKQLMSVEKLPMIVSRQMEATAYIYTNSEQMQQQQQQTNQQIKNDYFTPDQIIYYNIMKKKTAKIIGVLATCS